MYWDLYSGVWTLAVWAQSQGMGKRDAGNDLVTRTAATGAFHAIPIEAYEYVVNGISAIERVMERHAVKTDRDSSIVSNANDCAAETTGNARCSLALLLRVMPVSIETMKNVKKLPGLVI